MGCIYELWSYIYRKDGDSLHTCPRVLEDNFWAGVEAGLFY